MTTYKLFSYDAKTPYVPYRHNAHGHSVPPTPATPQTTPGEAEAVTIQVDFTQEKGLMKPIWAWWGYDEHKAVTMKGIPAGQALLHHYRIDDEPGCIPAAPLMVRRLESGRAAVYCAIPK